MGEPSLPLHQDLNSRCCLLWSFRDSAGVQPSLLFPFLFCAPLVAQRLKRRPPMRETWVRSLGRVDPLAKEMVTHSSILAWRILWTEKPVGYSPGVAESRTRLRGFTSCSVHTIFLLVRDLLTVTFCCCLSGS